MREAAYIAIAACLCFLCGAAQPADRGAKKKKKQSGPITHKIRSKYLGSVETTIHVLLPSTFDRNKRYKVLYILPVINGETSGKPRWGNPLAVAKEHKFADKYNAICVMATFDRGTLYVNHPTQKDMRHEDYFVKDVVPFIDKQYPTLAEARGRLLTGFCASGNGAMWLMLRHLDMFGKAAVWDTWLDIKKMHPPDKKQLGTEKNFQQYCVMNLVDKHAKSLKGGPTRIIMMAYRNNRDGHFSVNRFHDKLFDYGIPHVFEYHAREKHRWDSGWLPRAVGYLFMEDFSKSPKPAGEKSVPDILRRTYAAARVGNHVTLFEGKQSDLPQAAASWIVSEGSK